MFHYTTLGQFGHLPRTDLNGMVPEAGDHHEDMNFGPENDFTQDFDELGNGYEGYAANAWAEFVAECIASTETALKALEEWRRENSDGSSE